MSDQSNSGAGSSSGTGTSTGAAAFFSSSFCCLIFFAAWLMLVFPLFTSSNVSSSALARTCLALSTVLVPIPRLSANAWADLPLGSSSSSESEDFLPGFRKLSSFSISRSLPASFRFRRLSCCFMAYSRASCSVSKLISYL